MNRTYIGIDNGVTGSIGIIVTNDLVPIEAEFMLTPTIKMQDYTKTKKNITRLDFSKMVNILAKHNPKESIIVIERPMVNPTRFKATTSALRCLEATLNAIDITGHSYMFIDSKEWQKALLPHGVKGHDLKYVSLQIGMRLFSSVYNELGFKPKDMDGILIAEYSRRMKQ